MGVGLEGSMGFTQYLVSHKILLLFFQNSDSEQMQIQSEKLEAQSEKKCRFSAMVECVSKGLFLTRVTYRLTVH